MSFMRCEILPGSYDEKKDDGSLDIKYLDESLVHQMNIAKSFGITKTSLSIWSPPAISKDPPTTFGTDPKTKQQSNLKPSSELDYCRYIVRVFDYLTKTKNFLLLLLLASRTSQATRQDNGKARSTVQRSGNEFSN